MARHIFPPGYSSTRNIFVYVLSRRAIMSSASVVGFSGNITRPSKTRGFVEYVSNDAARRHGLASSIYDLEDLGPSFSSARWPGQLDSQAQDVVEAVIAADLLVIGTPTFKGSYSGLFKHFFDLLDPAALRGKPVILLATGGGDRHALIVEHQLRPLFGFFEALALPTAIYASERDFEDGEIASPAIRARCMQAITEAGIVLNNAGGQAQLAAE